MCFYNEAVLWSESKSQHQALAFGNRAFVWLKIKKFRLAKNDCENALQYEKFPKESVYKIYQRLGQACHQLGESRYDH